MSEINAIEINDLSKSFKERKAVDELNLTVKRGEIFGLLGQNGAGKTTTIKMLCGMMKPTGGSAKVCGMDLAENTEEIKKIINVSPQETAVAQKLSVRENMELICRIYGMNKKQAREKTDEMLERFSLTDRGKDKAKALSGGLQRKLSIALAIISSPQILFLDEPTIALDVRARRDLWKVIEQLKEHMTIILTTHYLEEAEHLCDRIAVMNNGKLVELGTVDEINARTGCDNFEDSFLKLTDMEESE